MIHAHDRFEKGIEMIFDDNFCLIKCVNHCSSSIWHRSQKCQRPDMARLVSGCPSSSFSCSKSPCFIWWCSLVFVFGCGGCCSCMGYPHRNWVPASTPHPKLAEKIRSKHRTLELRCPSTLQVTMWVLHTL